MKEVLEREPNLRIKQAEVAALRIEDGRRALACICVDGRTIRCGAVIITTGTFLEWVGACRRAAV
jgi:tRNA uridine 5-carboxymethylaminomethyl modification enzyme